MTVFWTIVAPLVLVLDGYMIGTLLERRRQVRRQQRRDAQPLAVVDDLRLFTTRLASPPDPVRSSDRRTA